MSYQARRELGAKTFLVVASGFALAAGVRKVPDGGVYPREVPSPKLNALTAPTYRQAMVDNRAVMVWNGSSNRLVDSHARRKRANPRFPHRLVYQRSRRRI